MAAVNAAVAVQAQTEGLYRFYVDTITDDAVSDRRNLELNRVDYLTQTQRADRRREQLIFRDHNGFR
jgi:hypothetical protein